MVRLTADYIVRYNGHTKRKRDEPTNQYLKRLTHLYMAERNIEDIVSICANYFVWDVFAENQYFINFKY